MSYERGQKVEARAPGRATPWQAAQVLRMVGARAVRVRFAADGRCATVAVVDVRVSK